MIRKVPVSMLMTTPVITLQKEDSLEKADMLFKKHHIRHIPIVEGNRVIGMLSYTDLQRLSFCDYNLAGNNEVDAMVYNMSINQVMKENIVTISAASSVKEAAEIFSREEFHALPVIKYNKLIGIITTTDLIKLLLNQF
ncbi:CBS domain-containing protein [Neotamlana laminarinivorans]|uniref:CBS domain-containing protein n=1 Tax=Neotamlana laminarinivorans TaxID=2883124 RepID=A0A9X1I1H1_9FLAO|nr:CBS domain-containing protein [Tamlana laminarinivorans]MCB4798813.1 CBS domain-containing protein [Tamlana laminarinivorans]